MIPVIITGRTSKNLENRTPELESTKPYQGKHENAETIMEVLRKHGFELRNAVYIGDDILDLPCMEQCGIAGYPGDAIQAVKDSCGYVYKAPGGHGAVRELIDWLVDN